MKKYRSNKVDDKWIPQYRFFLFYLIPTTIWVDFGYEFGDDFLLGLGLTSYSFSTKEESEQFLKSKFSNLSNSKNCYI